MDEADEISTKISVGGGVMKRISATISNDLLEHLEALKLYYGYSTRTEVIKKALDELISKCVSDDVFHYYLTGAREILRDREREQ